jgi:Protein of unknown function (DUF2854)
MPWQVLEFEKKPEMAFEEWTSRQDKFQSFFGPGVKASLEATEQVHHISPRLAHYSILLYVAKACQDILCESRPDDMCPYAE